MKENSGLSIFKTFDDVDARIEIVDRPNGPVLVVETDGQRVVLTGNGPYPERQ